MFEKIVFPVDDWPFTAHKKQGIVVVEQADFIGRQQFSARLLIVGRIATALALGFAIGIGIDRRLRAIC